MHDIRPFSPSSRDEKKISLANLLTSSPPHKLSPKESGHSLKRREGKGEKRERERGEKEQKERRKKEITVRPDWATYHSCSRGQFQSWPDLVASAIVRRLRRLRLINAPPERERGGEKIFSSSSSFLRYLDVAEGVRVECIFFPSSSFLLAPPKFSNLSLRLGERGEEILIPKKLRADGSSIAFSNQIDRWFPLYHQ